MITKGRFLGSALVVFCIFLLGSIATAQVQPLTPESESSIGENVTEALDTKLAAEDESNESPEEGVRFAPASVDSSPFMVLNAEPMKTAVRFQGSAYEMGYQHGYLLAEQVRSTCDDDFIRTILLSYLGSDQTLSGLLHNNVVFGAILSVLQTKAMTQSIFATADMRREMRGIAAGAIKRLEELNLDPGRISYERLVLVNLGFDVILAYAYPLLVNKYLSEEQREAVDASRIERRMHMCDGFIATAGATSTGGTIMGRSFMFSDIVGRNAMIMDYSPSNGNRFVAVNIPGFVGTPAAMNEHGLSIGMDMVPALRTNFVAPGMGCLLTARYVMQYTDSATSASFAIRNSYARGVPWIYIVGDPQGGVVVEAGATSWPGWWPSQQKFFAVRPLDYVFDPAKNPEPGIDQIETRNDLVVASNHFIDPSLRAAAKSRAVEDSMGRYDYLTGKVLEAAESGIDVEVAKRLINYLSPEADNPYGDDLISNPDGDGGVLISDYYKGSVYVQSIRAVFDMDTRMMHALYGLWTDPWVSYSLAP